MPKSPKRDLTCFQHTPQSRKDLNFVLKDLGLSTESEVLRFLLRQAAKERKL